MNSVASETPATPRSHRLEQDAWGVVLCGGKSGRMGRDKARLVLDGETLLARAARTLGELVPRVILACGPEPRYGDLGLETVLDDEQGLGPLAGLSAALARLQSDGIEYACVLACDMPRVSPGVFRALLELVRKERADVALIAADGGPEPLCGVYRVRALPEVRAALARGERRMIAFHPAVRVVTLDQRKLSADCRVNLNTPDEFRSEGGRWS